MKMLNNLFARLFKKKRYVDQSFIEKAKTIGCPECRQHDSIEEVVEYDTEFRSPQGILISFGQSHLLKCPLCGFVAKPDQGHQPPPSTAQAAYWWGVQAMRKNCVGKGRGVVGMTGSGDLKIKLPIAKGE